MKNFNQFNEFSNLPFVKKFEFATIYSKEEIEDWEFDKSDDLEEENEEEDYEKNTISKGTRIGIMSDPGEPNVDIVIVVEKEMNYFSHDGSLTCDGIVTFEVDTNVGYVPAQEPQDVLGYDEVDDDYFFENIDELNQDIKLYKLDNLLLSM